THPAKPREAATPQMMRLRPTQGSKQASQPASEVAGIEVRPSEIAIRVREGLVALRVRLVNVSRIGADGLDLRSLRHGRSGSEDCKRQNGDQGLHGGSLLRWPKLAFEHRHRRRLRGNPA